MRAALINSTTGLVENVIEVDEHFDNPGLVSDAKYLWPVPDGFTVVPSETAQIGMHADDIGSPS